MIAGCASVAPVGPDSPPEAKQQAVAARAKARWDALIQRDVAAAYQYLSPSSRKAMSLEVYGAKRKVGLYREARVDTVTCEADACTVALTVAYDYRRMKVETPLVEKWILVDGQAWLVE